MLCLFYKRYKHHTPPHLHSLIPKNFQSSSSLRATKEIPLLRVKRGFIKSSFGPSTIFEWNNLYYSLCNAPAFINDMSNINDMNE